MHSSSVTHLGNDTFAYIVNRDENHIYLFTPVFEKEDQIATLVLNRSIHIHVNSSMSKSAEMEDKLNKENLSHVSNDRDSTISGIKDTAESIIHEDERHDLNDSCNSEEDSSNKSSTMVRTNEEEESLVPHHVCIAAPDGRSLLIINTNGTRYHYIIDFTRSPALVSEFRTRACVRQVCWNPMLDKSEECCSSSLSSSALVLSTNPMQFYHTLTHMSWLKWRRLVWILLENNELMYLDTTASFVGVLAETADPSISHLLLGQCINQYLSEVKESKYAKMAGPRYARQPLHGVKYTDLYTDPYLSNKQYHHYNKSEELICKTDSDTPVYALEWRTKEEKTKNAEVLNNAKENTTELNQMQKTNDNTNNNNNNKGQETKPKCNDQTHKESGVQIKPREHRGLNAFGFAEPAQEQQKQQETSDMHNNKHQKNKNTNKEAEEIHKEEIANNNKADDISKSNITNTASHVVKVTEKSSAHTKQEEKEHNVPVKSVNASCHVIDMCFVTPTMTLQSPIVLTLTENGEIFIIQLCTHNTQFSHEVHAGQEAKLITSKIEVQHLLHKNNKNDYNSKGNVNENNSAAFVPAVRRLYKKITQSNLLEDGPSPVCIKEAVLDEGTGLHVVMILYEDGSIRGLYVSESELLVRVDEAPNMKAVAHNNKYALRQTENKNHTTGGNDNNNTDTTLLENLELHIHRTFSFHIYLADNINVTSNTIKVEMQKNILIVQYQNEKEEDVPSEIYMVAFPVWDQLRKGWTYYYHKEENNHHENDNCHEGQTNSLMERCALPIISIGNSIPEPLSFHVPFYCPPNCSFTLGDMFLTIVPHQLSEIGEPTKQHKAQKTCDGFAFKLVTLIKSAMLASYTTFECTNTDNENNYFSNDDDDDDSNGNKINHLLSTMASAHYEWLCTGELHGDVSLLNLMTQAKELNDNILTQKEENAERLVKLSNRFSKLQKRYEYLAERVENDEVRLLDSIVHRCGADVIIKAGKKLDQINESLCKMEQQKQQEQREKEKRQRKQEKKRKSRYNMVFKEDFDR